MDATLPVLGLLSEKPGAEWGFPPPDLPALIAAGLIDDGHRLTPEGSAALRRSIVDALRTSPAASPPFLAALTCLGALPKEEILGVLHERIARLRAEREALPDDTLEGSYLRRLVTVEAGWLGAAGAGIEEGSLVLHRV